jgi:hypothetical protein
MREKFRGSKQSKLTLSDLHIHTYKVQESAVSSASPHPAQRISLRCPLAEVMRTAALRFAYSEAEVDMHHDANVHIGASGTNQDRAARNSMSWPGLPARASGLKS